MAERGLNPDLHLCAGTPLPFGGLRNQTSLFFVASSSPLAVVLGVGGKGLELLPGLKAAQGS